MLNGNWINFTEGTDQDIIGRIRVDVCGCVSLIADDDHRILQDLNLNLLDYIGSGDNHFMRLNVSCLLTDFSYFETFWSEFKPENGQLAQNKADSKLTLAVSHPAQYYICIKFTLYLYLTVILPLHSICIVGELTPPAVSRPVVTISRLNFGFCQTMPSPSSLSCKYKYTNNSMNTTF